MQPPELLVWSLGKPYISNARRDRKEINTEYKLLLSPTTVVSDFRRVVLILTTTSPFARYFTMLRYRRAQHISTRKFLCALFAISCIVLHMVYTAVQTACGTVLFVCKIVLFVWENGIFLSRKHSHVLGSSHIPQNDLTFSIQPVDGSVLDELTPRSLKNLSMRNELAGRADLESCLRAPTFDMLSYRRRRRYHDFRVTKETEAQLVVTVPAGTISTSFDIASGVLIWHSDAFPDPHAGFCRDSKDRLFATFDSGAVFRPASCSPIVVTVSEGKIHASAMEIQVEKC